MAKLPPQPDLAAMQAHAGEAAKLLKALANERRLQVLCVLAGGERSVGEVNQMLGLLMLVPDPRHWLVRWLAATFAAFGLVVGITQNFSHWRRINAGEFQLAEAWWVDPFLLSGAAIFIISGLVLLLWSWRPGAGAAGRA